MSYLAKFKKMKKLIGTIGFIIFLSGSATATDFFVEVKAHYFSPSEQAFKDIYGGGVMYGAEATVGIWRNLEFWLGGSYFSKKGKLTFTEEETKLKIIPIGGGLRYILPKGKLNLYAGLGLNYYQYKETNPIGEAKKGGLGFIGKIGSFVKITGGLLIDVYADYTYCKIKPDYYDINIGGFEAGIGIGYEF